MLKIEHLYKKFGDNMVLNDISMSVDKNSILGIAGASGGGKSTLLRCIQGLDTQYRGSITCGGKVSFMFQDFQLFPHMTVMENITYAPRLHDKAKDHYILAKDILGKLGVLEKADEYPSKLSGGQKQRVALARSLMVSPDLLLCDEPTSGLDIATTSDVVSLLKMIRDMGVTILIASHDLDFLTKIADHIIALKGGRISAELSTTDVENPIEYLKKHY
ncbi:amino acid ABC transporter ATP-binding protein [Candidatus Hydrogenosomobacter endosymbioticus]|uniref:Polar amino acid ABC transporter ATP-binding protein n=1 Tax=Candidatus Hydrogenosomobacter endosymbioticus TaxID=2558174 RepID=A0ABN6L228_9PROT|nr:ATP-binding cassette domain-containing protein [Candidatus Hydrogenosomobacter endosymbioticus]BDB95876.1 polar amino acid ABC transporter ATP-binding protein [Candidatus Hydrogenosomobacter endosymbioticus]